MPAQSNLIEEIVGLLVDSSLFNQFSPAELHAAARYFNLSKISKGRQVFKEGEVGTFMCILSEGSVSVQKANSEDKVVEIAVLKPGRAFGEMAVLDGERRSATCIAASDCLLLILSKDALEKMLQDAPKVAAKVIRAIAVSLSKRLRMADFKLVDHQL